MAITNNSSTLKNITTSTSIPVSIGVFFDGTNNNKFNSNARKTYEDYKKQGKEPAKTNADGSLTDDYKAYHAYKKYTEEDGSYENDYSNIARMYGCTKDEDYSIYVQGAGSSSHKEEVMDKDGNVHTHIVYGSDKSRGLAFSTGVTGIRKHTQYACEEVAKKIAAAMPESKPGTPSPRLQVTIDVYGFSRGAATARNFVFEVDRKLKTPEQPTKVSGVSYGKKDAGVYPFNENADKQKYAEANDNLGIMPRGYLGYYLQQNHQINLHIQRVDIVFRFAGLYDTVGSYDNTGVISTDEFSNPYLLDLHRISSIMSNGHILHFTAKDEHRQYFALTKLPIKNAGMHREIGFHGVHSDIGGGYEDATSSNPEHQSVFVYGYNTAPWHNNSFRDIGIDMVALKNELAEEWIQFGSITGMQRLKITEAIEEQKATLKAQGWFKEGEMVQNDFSLETTRKLIPKKYSYIFLHLMCKYISGEKYWKDKDKAKPWEVTYYDTKKKEILPAIDFETLEATYKLDDRGNFFSGGFQVAGENTLVFTGTNMKKYLKPLAAFEFNVITGTNQANRSITDADIANMQWHTKLRTILESIFYEELHDAITDEQVFSYANKLHYNPDKVEGLQDLPDFKTIEEMMDFIDKEKYDDNKTGFDLFKANLATFNQLIKDQLCIWGLRHRYIHWNSRYKSTTLLAIVPVAYPYQPRWAGKVRKREEID